MLFVSLFLVLTALQRWNRNWTAPRVEWSVRKPPASHRATAIASPGSASSQGSHSTCSLMVFALGLKGGGCLCGCHPADDAPRSETIASTVNFTQQHRSSAAQCSAACFSAALRCDDSHYVWWIEGVQRRQVKVQRVVGPDRLDSPLR